MGLTPHARTEAPRLRVCVTVDPFIPVPPTLYGGIERAVDLLVRGLVRRGHHVHVFAHPESRTAGVLHPYGCPPHRSWTERNRELLQLGYGLSTLARDVDVIHSFGRLAALLPVLPRRIPKIQSYQREVPWVGVRRAVRLAGGTLTLTGCSASLYEPALRAGVGAGSWRAIFNPVDPGLYESVPSVADDAPLVFLGRVEEIKGPHEAVVIARLAGRRLIIAGPVASAGPDRDFFDRAVAPFVDGDRVVSVGPVDDAQKNQLLGQAAALLMPIQWEEPFGIVMAEALACGTPVIAYRRGSVPEVVRDGVNGFICHDARDAAAAVGRVGTLNRSAIRADCEARFGVDVIVDQYLALYRTVLGGAV